MSATRRQIGPSSLARPAPPARLTVAVSPVQRPSSALAVAVNLAGQAGMYLEVVEVHESGPAHTLPERYIDAMTERAERLGATGVGWVPLDASGRHVATAIADHLEHTRPTLACLSTRNRSTRTGPVLGRVSSAIVGQAPVPVLLVHPEAAIVERTTRILACLDGSDLAQRVLDPARDLATRLGATLQLVQVAEPSAPGPGTRKTTSIDETASRLADEGSAVALEVVHGPVRETITRLGNQRGTVLAFHTRGHTGSTGFPLGRVPRNVIHRARCPVLVTGPALVRRWPPQLGR